MLSASAAAGAVSAAGATAWIELFTSDSTLAMLLAIAFLLLVSLVASWLLAEFSTWIDDHAADWLTSRVIWALNTGVSLTIITLLFAAILKFVPDAEVRWSDVWAGAVATSLLFVLGKVGLGLYLAWSNPTSAPTRNWMTSAAGITASRSSDAASPFSKRSGYRGW